MKTRIHGWKLGLGGLGDSMKDRGRSHDEGASRHYEIFQEIAAGGMARVYLGCRRAPGGFQRIVAIKQAHQELIGDPRAVDDMVNEAILASSIHHPNVVPIVDVEVSERSVLLVMDYIEGISLAQLMVAGTLGPAMVARIALDVCAGLHAVHEARNDAGEPLGLVHRDISPQNILIGIDGTARIADFGIAKASLLPSARTTGTHVRKGKPGYMAPDYIKNGRATAASDVYSLGVVLWEALTGRRLFVSAATMRDMLAVRSLAVPAPSKLVEGVPPALDEVALRALGRSESPAFTTAAQLGDALRAALEPVASHAAIGRLVEGIAGPLLRSRRETIRAKKDREVQPSVRHPARLSVHEMPTCVEALDEVTPPLHVLPDSLPAPARPERTVPLEIGPRSSVAPEQMDSVGPAAETPSTHEPLARVTPVPRESTTPEAARETTASTPDATCETASETSTSTTTRHTTAAPGASGRASWLRWTFGLVLAVVAIEAAHSAGLIPDLRQARSGTIDAGNRSVSAR